MTKQYEITLIYKPDFDSNQLNEEVAKVEKLIKAHNGSILSREDIGQKQLAYPIEKHTHGIYVLLVIEAGTSFGEEFNRQTNIDTNVLRSMMVLKDQYAPDYVAPVDDEEDDDEDDEDDDSGSSRRANS